MNALDSRLRVNDEVNALDSRLRGNDGDATRQAFAGMTEMLPVIHAEEGDTRHPPKNYIVIPAEAGIQSARSLDALDSRLRGNDDANALDSRLRGNDEVDALDSRLRGNDGIRGNDGMRGNDEGE